MLIAISGKIGNGKDAIADHLVKNYGFTIVRFSDALKEEVIERLPRTLKVFHDSLDYHGGINRNCQGDCIRQMVYVDKPHGVRELLQEYGSEVRRKDSATYWVDRWVERVAKHPRVVTPDVRFPNEASAVMSQRGHLWRVVRAGMTETGDHQSETSLDAYSFGTVIQNDGTLAQLYEKVDTLVKVML